MRWAARAVALTLIAAAVAIAATLGDPDPPEAEAVSIPCIAISPSSAITGALGIGNPVADACDAIVDPVLDLSGKALQPLKDAAAGIGKGIFNQVTAWVADGAVWLIGEVAALTEKSTTPNLLSKGFLRQYRVVASLAALMAALMLVFTVLEAIGRGDSGMLWRAFFVNAPLAGIATTVAYVVVQLLVATSDGMSEVILQSTGNDARQFFQGAVKALAQTGASTGEATGAAAGGSAGGAAAGAVAVPLFVGFIAAIVAAFAAFFVWIELLMRDAAIYVVALFMPMALAASIWPRWSAALRRTCELLVVIVFSKFVIVAILSLAASLVANNENGVEHVLAAGAMLLLACFAPFVLLKLVPFAEGAAASAFNRQSASGGTMRVAQNVSQVQMMRRMAGANWGGGGSSGGGGAKGGGAGRGSGSGGGGGAKGGGRNGGGPQSGGGAKGGGGGNGAAAGAGAAAATLDAPRKGAQGAASRLGSSGVAQSAGTEREGASPGGSRKSSPTAPGAAGSAGGAKQPNGTDGAKSGQGEAPGAKPDVAAPRPRPASGGGAGAGESSPPRPASGEKKGRGGGEAK